MKKFRCKFNGRKIGALGIFYTIEIIVEAENAEQAHLKCYETHEHISPWAGFPQEIKEESKP